MRKKEVKLPFQEFKLSTGPYWDEIPVIITEDTEAATNYVKKHHNRTNLKKEDFSSWTGCTFHHDSKDSILWMPRYPETSMEKGTLNHEIFHLVCDVSKRKGFWLNESSEEAFAYLISYLTKQFYDKGKSATTSK